MEEILILLQKGMDLIIMSRIYNLVVICGPAGSGKNYIIDKLASECPESMNLVIPDTTRPPRDSEQNGVQYNFLTGDEFFKKKHFDETCFNNWYYGTPMDAIVSEKSNVLILNPSALLYIYNRQDTILHWFQQRDKMEDIKIRIQVFYINAPDRIRIQRQLNREFEPNVHEICRRFLADEEDFIKIKKIPMFKLNNVTESDAEECIAVIKKSIDWLKTHKDKMD